MKGTGCAGTPEPDQAGDGAGTGKGKGGNGVAPVRGGTEGKASPQQSLINKESQFQTETEPAWCKFTPCTLTR